MPILEKVTDLKKVNDFCLTDCNPSDGCCPDDFVPESTKEEKK